MAKQIFLLDGPQWPPRLFSLGRRYDSVLDSRYGQQYMKERYHELMIVSSSGLPLRLEVLQDRTQTS